MSESKEGKITIKIPKSNYWIIISLVLAIVLILSLIQGWSVGGKTSLSANETAQKAINYINNNLVQPGDSVTLFSVEDLKSVYKVTTLYQGSKIPVYISKDGNYLFLSAYDTSENTGQATTNNTQTAEEIPKTDKPTVQLYVMSFCPYGIQAENTMKPVVDLLGAKATIETHYIVSVSGTTVNSLHGDYEATEDMRQACIWKYYDQATFWKYVSYFNSNCNKNNIDTCWKDAAKNASIDTVKIGTCVTNEGLTLMKVEEALSSQNGVTGSPTLIINGYIDGKDACNSNADCINPGQTCVQTSSGKVCMISRTSEAYKQAICSAFTTQPSECSQNVSSTTTTASSGGCG